jgi:DNA-binding transcriptional LysR family regulator
VDFLGKAQALVRVVETGSLSKAARSLGLSLAAVSRQITSLEGELGAPLLLRTTRSLRLTAEGRRFHEHAVRLVREAALARATVQHETPTGVLVVSASVSLGLLRIVPQLPRFLATHPGVELDLRLEDRAADLVAEGVDVAVRGGIVLPDTTQIVAHPLAKFARLAVASPAYLRHRGVPRTVSSLAGHATILEVGAAPIWRFVEDGKDCEVAVTPSLRVGTLVARLEAVRADLGVALLPEFVVRADVAAGRVRVVLPRASLAPVSVYALHRTELRGTSRIDVFVRHLKETIATSPRPPRTSAPERKPRGKSRSQRDRPRSAIR